MKLFCSLPARADGTVRLRGADGKDYVFAPTGDGETCADVPQAVAAPLLATGNFYPADPPTDAPADPPAETAGEPAKAGKGRGTRK
jgi:hypothetical protein